MVTKVFLNRAHQALSDSYWANDRGKYLEAWGKSVPARLNYLADAAINAAAVPYYAGCAGYGAVETTFTWGRETKCLKQSLRNVDNSLSRVLFGAIGGVVSPAGAKALEVDSFAEAVVCAAVVASVASVAIYAVQHVRIPDSLYWNSQFGWTFGWT